MKHIYFVRHGESEGNVDGIRRGATTKLTESGHKQANIVAKRFRDVPIEVVLTSPYERAYNTGKAVAEMSDVPLEVVDLAHERILPDEVIGKSRHDADVIKIVDEIMQGWLTGDVNHPTAEDYLEIVARADKLRHVIERMNEEHIVITSHSLFGKIFTQRILLGEYMSPEIFFHMAWRMKPSNTGITHFIIGDDEQWTLINWNDDAHLGELV